VISFSEGTLEQIACLKAFLLDIYSFALALFRVSNLFRTCCFHLGEWKSGGVNGHLLEQLFGRMAVREGCLCSHSGEWKYRLNRRQMLLLTYSIDFGCWIVRKWVL